MIELLINKQTRKPIAAKPAGGRWTARELDGPNLCVVELIDPPEDLAQAVARRGVVANPFAERGTDPVTGLAVMIRQSTVKLRQAHVRPGARLALTDTEAVHQ